MIENRPCDICASRPAKMVIVRRRRDDSDRTFVCLECANERARLYGADGIGRIIDRVEARAAGGSESSAGCRLCGTTLAEIVADAKPGCSMCYSRFEAEIEPAIRSAQGRTRHTGKAPGQ